MCAQFSRVHARRSHMTLGKNKREKKSPQPRATIGIKSRKNSRRVTRYKIGVEEGVGKFEMERKWSKPTTLSTDRQCHLAPLSQPGLWSRTGTRVEATLFYVTRGIVTRDWGTSFPSSPFYPQKKSRQVSSVPKPYILRLDESRRGLRLWRSSLCKL